MKTTAGTLPAKPGRVSRKGMLWNTHHDLPEENRLVSIGLINQQLADALDLGLQAKQAHWNVKGSRFLSLHALFDEVAETAGELADELAERAVTLGGTARGTLQEVQTASRLEPYPTDAQSGSDHVWSVARALARFAKSSRDAIDAADDVEDAGSSDLFAQVSRTADKLLWKVEAHTLSE